MAIVSIHDSKDGQDISWSGQSGRVYSNSLIVLTDDASMGPRAIVKALGLRNGDYYRFPWATTATEWDYSSFIQQMSAKKTADDGRQWLVELEYGPFDWTGIGGATADAAAEGRIDPFAIPPQVSWGSAKREFALLKDVNGKPIRNTAGDPFDPPLTREITTPVLTIVRNEPTFDPLTVTKYVDTTNGTVFLGFDTNVVKCADVVSKRDYHADYGYYWEVTYSFEVRPVRYDSTGRLTDNGWVREVLNAGLREIDVVSGDRQQIIIDQHVVTSPVLLTQGGVYIEALGDDPYYLEFQIYPQLDYSIFNFPDDLLTVQSVAGFGGFP